MAKFISPEKEYSKNEDVDVINYKASFTHISEDNVQMCEKVKDILPLVNYVKYSPNLNLMGVNSFLYKNNVNESLIRLVTQN